MLPSNRGSQHCASLRKQTPLQIIRHHSLVHVHTGNNTGALTSPWNEESITPIPGNKTVMTGIFPEKWDSPQGWHLTEVQTGEHACWTHKESFLFHAKAHFINRGQIHLVQGELVHLFSVCACEVRVNMGRILNGAQRGWLDSWPDNFPLTLSKFIINTSGAYCSRPVIPSRKKLTEYCNIIGKQVFTQVF